MKENIIQIITVLSIITGGIMWLTTLDNRTRATASDIKDIQRIYPAIRQIDSKVSRIEGRQDIIIDILKRDKTDEGNQR